MHANHRGLLQTHLLDARRGVRCRRVEPRASLVTRSLSLLTQVAQRLGWRAFSLNPRCSCFLCSFPSRDTEHLSQMFSFSALFRLLVPAQSGGTLWKKTCFGLCHYHSQSMEGAQAGELPARPRRDHMEGYWMCKPGHRCGSQARCSELASIFSPSLQWLGVWGKPEPVSCGPGTSLLGTAQPPSFSRLLALGP